MKKTIVVRMNKKSVDEAVFKLKVLRKFYPKMQYEFMQFVCEWIIERANFYIEMADLGSLVKSDIQNSWDYDIFPDYSAKITNNAQKAVFVEFGVGIVGQGQPHPNANKEGYEYNKIDENSPKTKIEDGTWYFWTNSNELDLPLSALTDIRGHDDYRGERGKRLVVGTQGAKGVMYAYNAIVDAKTDLANPNGVLATEWNKILERYIG